MNETTRARRVSLERKAFRAARLPKMPSVDRAGISTKPWGARGIRGIGLTGSADPSRTAMQAWERATGVKPANPLRGLRRRRARSPFLPTL